MAARGRAGSTAGAAPRRDDGSDRNPPAGRGAARTSDGSDGSAGGHHTGTPGAVDRSARELGPAATSPALPLRPPSRQRNQRGGAGSAATRVEVARQTDYASELPDLSGPLPRPPKHQPEVATTAPDPGAGRRVQSDPGRTALQGCPCGPPCGSGGWIRGRTEGVGAAVGGVVLRVDDRGWRSSIWCSAAWACGASSAATSAIC